MSTFWGLGIEINTGIAHFRAYRGDCELRIGPWCQIALWGIGSGGGLFLQTKSGERYWPWMAT